MYKNPTISIIVLTYNKYRTTFDCVDSILKSSYKNIEILIVDNASTDDSAKKLKQRYGQKKIIKLIEAPSNLWYTGGFNLGSKYANGDLLFIATNDLVFHKNCFVELVKEMQIKALLQPKILRLPERKILDNAGGKYTFYGIGQGLGGGELDHGQYDRNAECDFVAGAGFMISRSFFQELKGFDPWYGIHYEDVDISLRAKKAGGVCKYCYQAVTYHQVSTTLAKHKEQPLILFNARKNRLRTILKNFTGVERVLRIFCVAPLYMMNILSDILSFKRSQMTLTIRAVKAASRYKRA